MSENIDVNLLFNAVDNLSKAVGQMKQSLGGFKQETEKTSKKVSMLQDALSSAAGFMIRDFARSITTTISESVKLGAQVDTLKTAFDRLVETTGATNLNLKSLRDATRKTVSDIDLLTSANRALSLGIPADRLNELYAAAMKLGPAMGITTAQAVDRLSIGIGRMSKLVLDDLGVVFSAEESYEWWGKQINKTAKELTESEKKLGWQNYAMKEITESAEKLGDTMSDTQLAQEQFAAATENAKTEVGKAIGPFGFLVTAIEPLMPMFSMMTAMYLPKLIGQIPRLTRLLPDLIGYLTTMDLGWKGVAIGVAGFFAAFAIGESILNALPGTLRDIAAALMIAVGAVVAATVAWMAFHTTVSFGTAAAIILPAVGLAIAGLKSLLASHIEGLAEGGIVTKPTIALVGERGPEAVIPLSRGGITPQIREVNIYQSDWQISSAFDAEEAANVMYQQFMKKIGAKW